MKKKNLLKCLALTSMLALTVGAVTSCGTQGAKGDTGATGAQGPKGDKGDTGATGAQGPKGDKGDTGAAGADGKTYLPVIVLADPANVSISQDQYFVEVGESFTLTFTADDTAAGKAIEMVTKLVINGEEIAIPAGQMSYTYTAIEGDKGFQIQSAEFGSVVSYAQGLLNDYYDAMVKADAQLKVRTGTELAAEKRGKYYDATVLGQLGTLTLDANVQAVIDALKNPTISDKVAAVEDYVKTSEAAIDKAYAKLVTDAKAAGKTALETLYKSGTKGTVSGFWKEADRNSELESAESALDGVKTLQGVTNLIDDTVSLTTKGSYNVLEAARTEVKGKIDAYLNTNSVSTTDKTYFDSEAGKAVLANYGITVTPNTVLADTLNSLSSATALAKLTSGDNKGEYGFYVDFVAAYDGAYKTIKDSLRSAILASYDADITASKVVTNEQSRTVIHGLVDSTIDTWLNATANKGTNFSVAKMLSGAAGGLIKAIDDALSADWASFNAERLASAVAGLKTLCVNAATDIKTADATYAKAITKVGDPLAYPTNLVVVDKDTDITVTNAFGGAAAYDVDVKAAAIYNATYSDVSTATEAKLTAKSQIEAIYNAALTKYVADAKAAVITGDAGNFAKADIEAEYDGLTVDGSNLVVKSFAEVNTVAGKADVWNTLLAKLSTAWNGWLDSYATVQTGETVAKDANIKTYVIAGTDLYDSYADMGDKIFASTVTAESEVTAWKNTLDGMYSGAVANYLLDAQASMKAVADTKKTEVLAGGLSASEKETKVAAINAAYAKVLTYKFTKIVSGTPETTETTFTVTSYTGVGSWLVEGSAYIVHAAA